MRTSYSALSTYSNCPKKYKYQYIDGEKPSTKSEVMVFGSLIHSALQYYHGTDPHPTPEDLLDFFSQKWKSTVYDDEVHEQQRFQEGLGLLSRYAETNDPAKVQTVALEMPFQVTLERGSGREPLVVTGIIDRIDKLPDGRFEVIDYKTGRTLPSQDAVDQNLQLSVYWMAIRDRWPNRDMAGTLVSLYFVKHNEKIRSRRTVEDIDRTKREIFSIVDSIESGKFHPTPSALCGYCEYREKCPMMRHKYRKAVAEDLAAEEAIAGAVDRYIQLKDEEKKLKLQIKSLSSDLLAYCEEHDLMKLFSESNSSSVALTRRETHGYDEQQLRTLLEEHGRWDDVRKLDAVALRRVVQELPASVQRCVEDLKEVKRVSTSLSVKRKE